MLRSSFTTVCPKGHKYTSKDYRIRKGKNVRHCKKCDADRAYRRHISRGGSPRSNLGLAGRVKRSQLWTDAVRSNTYCKLCGRQPIDWHNPEHLKHPYRRVGKMAGGGRTISAIAKEISNCIPLCRSCHMKEDGRLDTLLNRPRLTTPAKNCSACNEKYKPLRAGLCAKCYDRIRYKTRYKKRLEYCPLCKALLERYTNGRIKPCKLCGEPRVYSAYLLLEMGRVV